jgi:ribonuclease P protein component
VGEKRNTFPRTHRLGGKLAFAQVYDARVRVTRGPLTVYAKANGLEHSRMGISIPRRVGSAPKRNRIKRLLRESYRLMRAGLPLGFDWIVVVRGHEVLALNECQELMGAMTQDLARKWEKRTGS